MMAQARLRNTSCHMVPCTLMPYIRATRTASRSSVMAVAARSWAAVKPLVGEREGGRFGEVGMEVLRCREATGMTREEVARQLEWSPSTLFRIETGRSRPQPGNVRMLLELYGVTGPERDGLIQLTREARQPGWWHSFRDVLPNPYEVYIGLEAGAASIRNFDPIVVPGLLQTEAYARDVFRNRPSAD
jgi:transcriptional regulator with XRE-family HTH domain